MYSHELFEAGKPNIVVVFPGRFQPFHQGHAGVFTRLQKKFGIDNVYVATSNDQSSAKSPFNFSDKYQLITAAGVPGDKIIETNSMYTLPEGFDPTNTIYVAAVGAPDRDRLRPDSVITRDKKDKEGNVIKPAGSPSYYKSWKDNEKHVTSDQHGYVIVIPEIKKSITINGKTYDVSHGTECRNLWNIVRDDHKGRNEFLAQLYGRAGSNLVHIFNKIPVVREDISADTDSTTSPISGHSLPEDVSGYIPKAGKEIHDPRWSTALSVDVHPDSLKKNLKAFNLAEMQPSDFEIHNFEKLDNILLELCQLIIEGQKQNPDFYGLVAACVLDPENNKVCELNYLADNGQRIHAERAAIDAYTEQFGEIPEGSIIITTLSPCNESMDERYGESCQDIINASNVRKVYCGFKDPTQNDSSGKLFHVMETRFKPLSDLCKKFASKFLDLSDSLNESMTVNREPDLPEMFRSFLPFVMKQLGLEKLPKIVLAKEIKSGTGQPTFGRFVNNEQTIYLAIANRHPNDILRTLAHELTHFKQYINGELDSYSGKTGSPEENEANALAGIMMRHYNNQHPDSLNLKPVMIQ